MSGVPKFPVLLYYFTWNFLWIITIFGILSPNMVKVCFSFQTLVYTNFCNIFQLQQTTPKGIISEYIQQNGRFLPFASIVWYKIFVQITKFSHFPPRDRSICRPWYICPINLRNNLILYSNYIKIYITLPRREPYEYHSTLRKTPLFALHP